MNKHVFTENAPSAVGPYSQAVISEGLMFCSGQIAINPATQQMIDGDVVAQTKQVCENIAAVLGAAGLCYDDVIKATVFLESMDDFDSFNEVYAQYFTSKPARSCVAVSALPKAAKVEIEVIARKNDPDDI